MRYVKQVETVMAKTGGAELVAIQVVHHKHCRDPDCENEGHCHMRVKRADNSVGTEWLRANGTIEQFKKVVNKTFRGVPVEIFEELFEADEKGLSAETFGLVDAVARRARKSVDLAALGECSICMESLDGSQIVGGFAKMAVCDLPCHHSFHVSCYKQWANKHTTCPCCRSEITHDNVLELAQRVLPSSHPVLAPKGGSSSGSKLPSVAPEGVDPVPRRQSRLWKGLKRVTGFSSLKLPRIRQTPVRPLASAA